VKQIISAALATGFVVLSGNMIAARAADITVLASNGLKAAVVELVPQFEKDTGHRLVFTWGRIQSSGQTD
jgi:ABC-type molybdate transport system substrate-binding protein